MMTNSRFSAVRPENRVDHSDEGSNGFVGQTMQRVRQSLCGMQGHDSLLHFEQDRMFLRCTNCGHETPGWEIGREPRTNPSGRDDARSVSVPHLVGARRIA